MARQSTPPFNKDTRLYNKPKIRLLSWFRHLQKNDQTCCLSNNRGGGGRHNTSVSLQRVDATSPVSFCRRRSHFAYFFFENGVETCAGVFLQGREMKKHVFLLYRKRAVKEVTGLFTGGAHCVLLYLQRRGAFFS